MAFVWVSIAIIAAVVAVDQITKALIVAFLYKGQLVLIEGVLNFTYVENRGMAFGLLADHRWIFLLCSVVGIAAMAFYLFRYVKQWLPRVGLALVVGGGIGNMIDRLAYGYVIDFIDFCAFDFWYWVFNVADAAVCVGAAIFILSLMMDVVKDVRAQKTPKGENVDATKATPTSNDRGEDENG